MAKSQELAPFFSNADLEKLARGIKGLTKDQQFNVYERLIAVRGYYERERQANLEAVLREVTDWQREQFPQRTAHSIATHLLEEAQELQRSPADAEEMADVMMLLAGLAAFNGYDLASAVRPKLAKNKARTWGSPDEDGVVKHVKGGLDGKD